MSCRIRVECRNNADCRRFTALDGVRGAKSRHNGGKVMIVTCEAHNLDDVTRALDDSQQVSGYEVQP